MFKRDLKKDIIGDTSGDLKDILVKLLEAKRPTGSKVDVPQAKLDANKLVEILGKKEKDDNLVCFVSSFV